MYSWPLFLFSWHKSDPTRARWRARNEYKRHLCWQRRWHYLWGDKLSFSNNLICAFYNCTRIRRSPKNQFPFFRILHDSGWRGRLKRKVIWTVLTTNQIQIQIWCICICITLSPHPDSRRFPNHSWFSTGTGGPNLDDYLKDRFNLDLLCASQGRLVWRECSNNVVIKVNLCLSCCASNKFQSFRYLKILLLSIYYYSLFLWANVSARYKHHAWSLKCSENANELDLSTRASLKHGMVYKTRKNSGGML